MISAGRYGLLLPLYDYVCIIYVHGLETCFVMSTVEVTTPNAI